MMYLRTRTEEVDQMASTMERTLHDQRVAAARLHNSALLTRAAECWITSVADDASAPEIEERLRSLGPARCESTVCLRVDNHEAHMDRSTVGSPATVRAQSHQPGDAPVTGTYN
jgi:hypothetical protein